MDVLRSLVIAFACFSKIPMPRVDWREQSMRYCMCFFPLIGLVIGLCLWVWAWLCGALGFGSVLRGAGIALLPLAVTGGIHMDGFADVVDAQSSHAEPDRKRQILKDPHTGAFAIIGVASYLLLYAALATEVATGWRACLLLACLHWMSRCTSGIATVAFPRSSKTGMLAAFGDSAHKRACLAVLAAEWLAGAAVMLWASLPVGAGMALACALALACLHRFAMTQFNGMSGDLAGFLLQVAELAMLACLVVLGRLVMLA
jgi:adenosylcobinamide-GDP ribazoletransferase